VCDEYRGLEQFDILRVDETYHDYLYDCHQNHHDVLLLSLTFEAVETHQPSPASSEENKCNHEQTLGEGRLDWIVEQIAL
jgi:hypothetical protein